MKIITISREFGSGGRELGRKIAQILGYDYYDKEIITAIAEQTHLEEGQVEHALETHQWQTLPLTLRHSFASPTIIQAPQINVLLEQKRVIEKIAKAKNNCVIVGRNADVLLHEEHPFNVFVCADMQTKIKRCKERAELDEGLNDKDIKRNIMRIDKNRARARFMLADGSWGDRKSYHLIINTSEWKDVSAIAPHVANIAKTFFENNDL